MSGVYLDYNASGLVRPEVLDVMARAHCYKLTRSIAFVRAVAYDRDPEDPVATGQATFMLDSSAGKKPGANFKPPRETRAKTGSAGQ